MSKAGLVVRGHGRHYLVEADDGSRLLCHVRGKKSELVVGDRVSFAASGDEGVIERQEPRRNLLYRQDVWKTKSFAANIDQMLVLVAVDPVFSESQLARALIAAESAGIRTAIALNKTDLPGTPEAKERLAPYRAMGLPVFEVALKADPAGSRATLLPWLHGQHSFVLGPSGTGKSTLINLLVPDAQAQVGEISEALNSGRHTTTHTQWYWLDDGPHPAGTQAAPQGGEQVGLGSGPATDLPPARRTALIDSPGFQEFGLQQIAPPDLARWMPDLREHLGHCKFHNCSHQHEPGCGVIAAVEAGRIAASRYRLYGEILAELGAKRW
ncbi:ribosome small subunit-dependent GTPase A [Roseateles sp.]|uniref:ribosome small subunit-dependent GTPase A n=1 Tax=Roseateles sp. TaxID=1971397 RepID=UPI003949DC85